VSIPVSSDLTDELSDALSGQKRRRKTNMWTLFQPARCASADEISAALAKAAQGDMPEGQNWDD